MIAGYSYFMSWLSEAQHKSAGGVYWFRVAFIIIMEGATPNNGFVVGMSESENAVKKLVDAVVQANKDVEGALMPVLHGIQAKLGYIPMSAVPLITESLGFSRR